MTHDTNPFIVMHGLPQPASASLTAPHTLVWSLGLSITNTLNTETTGNEALWLDYEGYVLDISLHYALSPHWALKLNLPLIHWSGGFLDNTIDSWHSALNLPRAGRPNVANDQLLISHVVNGTTEYEILTTSSGIGDAQLSVGHQWYQSPQHALSAWLIAELPTGDPNRLTGNDTTDYAALLASRHELNPAWSLYSNLGVAFPGSASFNGSQLASSISFGLIGVQWQLADKLALKAQLNGHSRIYANSALRILGSSNTATFGGSYQLSACTALDFAVTEDSKVESAPDVSFLFTLRNIGC